MDQVNNRDGHVVAVWKEVTLVWGGSSVTWKWDDTLNGHIIPYWDPSIVQCHRDGIWMSKTTAGQGGNLIDFFGCIFGQIFDLAT